MFLLLLSGLSTGHVAGIILGVILLFVIIAVIIVTVLFFALRHNKTSHMLKYFQPESPEFKGHVVSSSIEQDRELNRRNNRELCSSDKDTSFDVDDNNRDSYIEHLDNDLDLDSKNSQTADI